MQLSPFFFPPNPNALVSVAKSQGLNPAVQRGGCGCKTSSYTFIFLQARITRGFLGLTDLRLCSHRKDDFLQNPAASLGIFQL